MIGLSSAVLLLFNGDVLGASGIIASVLTNPFKALKDPSNLWKVALLTAFSSTSMLMPQFSNDPGSSSNPQVAIPSTLAYSVAGLLVGFGTRLGNGCTSGHGVCGLGRESPRSFAAVLVFMATGIATAIVTSPSAPWASGTAIFRTDKVTPNISWLGYGATGILWIGLLAMPKLIKNKKISISDEDKQKVVGGSLAGVIFGAGLAISGMVLPSKLNLFLNMSGVSEGWWDPTLVVVLGSAVPVSFLAYQLVPNFGHKLFGQKAVLKHPLKTAAFHIPTNRKIDRNLLLGEAIFGVGWAIGSLCPGPALYHVAVGNPMVIFLWMPGFVLGSILAQEIKAKQQ